MLKKCRKRVKSTNLHTGESKNHVGVRMTAEDLGFGIDKATQVSRVCLGKRKSYRGYFFEFI